MIFLIVFYFGCDHSLIVCTADLMVVELSLQFGLLGVEKNLPDEMFDWLLNLGTLMTFLLHGYRRIEH